MTEQTRIIDLIEKTIDSYERMLQKIVIEGDKQFNSQPYEQSIHALNQVLEVAMSEAKDKAP